MGGNYRFRLSSMMPNAWFYKLKDMSRGSRGNGMPISSHPARRITGASTPKPIAQPYLPNRTSYYFPSREQLSDSPIHPKASDTHFPIDPSRKSRRRARRPPSAPRAKLVTSSVSSGCAAMSSVCNSDSIPHPLPHQHVATDHIELCSIESMNSSARSSATDIIINLGSSSRSCAKQEFDAAAELNLPPILTKMKKSSPAAHSGSGDCDSHSHSPSRRLSRGIHPIKISSRRRGVIQKRRSLADSLAIVKSSSDPQRDFRESMMEMIIENNIYASTDLEELLACYLSLNSDEYHDIIVKVFKQIWFELTDV